MTVRGRVRGNGRQAADYLLRQGDNDTLPTVFDIRGMAFSDARKSIIAMALMGQISKRSDKSLYHVVLNPGRERPLTRQEWFRAAEILEEETDYQEAERVMVLHTKSGFTHCHLIYARWDMEKNRMRPDGYNRFAQNRARMKMEKEFGLTQYAERNQEEPKLRRLVTKLWHQTSSGDEFIRECYNHGYTIAKGTNPPYVIVNAYGRSFDLSRNLVKVKKSDVRLLFRGRDLPTDKQIVKTIRAKQKEQAKNPKGEKIRKLREQMDKQKRQEHERER